MDPLHVATLNRRITRLTRWIVVLGTGWVFLGALLLLAYLWPSPPSYPQDRYACQMETRTPVEASSELLLWTRCMEARGWDLRWMNDSEVREELAGRYSARDNDDVPRPKTEEEKEQERQARMAQEERYRQIDAQYRAEQAKREEKERAESDQRRREADQRLRQLENHFDALQPKKRATSQE